MTTIVAPMLEYRLQWYPNDPATVMLSVAVTVAAASRPAQRLGGLVELLHAAAKLAAMAPTMMAVCIGHFTGR